MTPQRCIGERSPRRRPSADRDAGTAESGFALVAALIAVAVVGLATAATAVSMSMVRRRADEEQLLYVGDQYRRAIQAYAESTPIGQSRYPAQLADLLRDPRYPTVRRYLRALYPDPVTGRVDWFTVAAPGGGIMGIYSSSTKAPLKRELFEPPFQNFAHASSYANWRFCYPDCPLP